MAPAAPWASRNESITSKACVGPHANLGTVQRSQAVHKEGTEDHPKVTQVLYFKGWMGNCVLRNTQRRTHEVDTGLAATKGRTRLFAPICCKVFNFGCTRELCRELLKFLVPGTHLQGFRCGRRGHRAVFKARHMIPMCSPA